VSTWRPAGWTWVQTAGGGEDDGGGLAGEADGDAADPLADGGGAVGDPAAEAEGPTAIEGWLDGLGGGELQAPSVRTVTDATSARRADARERRLGEITVVGRRARRRL
jgi:hypothetical protein